MLDAIADPDLRKGLRRISGPIASLYIPHTPGEQPDNAPFPSRLFGDALP